MLRLTFGRPASPSGHTWRRCRATRTAHLPCLGTRFLRALPPIAGVSQPVVRAGHVPALPAPTLRAQMLATYADPTGCPFATGAGKPSALPPPPVPPLPTAPCRSDVNGRRRANLKSDLRHISKKANQANGGGVSIDADRANGACPLRRCAVTQSDQHASFPASCASVMRDDMVGELARLWGPAVRRALLISSRRGSAERRGFCHLSSS